MASIFDIFDETRERQTLKCFTPSFPRRLDSRLNEKLRSKSDSCSPFGKYLSGGKSTPVINVGCSSSVKMISKSPVMTARTPLQTLQLHSQENSRKISNEDLKKPRGSLKPFKLFGEEPGSSFQDENGERAKTPFNDGCPSGKMIKSPLSTPRIPFQMLTSNSQQHAGRTWKGGLKKPKKLIKSFKIFEDPKSEPVFQDAVNDRPPSKSYSTNKSELFSDNLHREKYVIGIRRRKYITLDKESQKTQLNADKHGQRTSKDLKRNCKLMKEIKIFEDPESKSLCDVNYISSSQLVSKTNRDLLPGKENEVKYVQGIRRKKYVSLAVRPETLNSQQHGLWAPKNKVKRNCKLMKKLDFFEDPELKSIFHDNVNEHAVDAITCHLPPTETVGESFWSEENYTPLWDNMLTRDDINTINTIPDVCGNAVSISDLCDTPEIPCTLIDDGELKYVPSTPAFTLLVDSPEDIPVPWES